MSTYFNAHLAYGSQAQGKLPDISVPCGSDSSIEGWLSDALTGLAVDTAADQVYMVIYTDETRATVQATITNTYAVGATGRVTFPLADTVITFGPAQYWYAIKYVLSTSEIYYAGQQEGRILGKLKTV